MKNNDVDKLISDLADDLEKTPCSRHPVIYAVLWIVAAVCYIAFAVSVFSCRFDIFEKIEQPFFVFEIALVSSIVISAVLSSLWMRVPDMRGAHWMPVVPYTLFFVLCLLILIRFIMEQPSMPTPDFVKICYKKAFVFGFIPATSLFFLCMRGNTTHPLSLSFLNALSIGCLGYIGLRLTCGSDDIGHMSICHILPFFAVGALVILFARRIYKW